MSATTAWAKRRLLKENEGDEPSEGELGYLDGRWLWVSETPPPEGEDEFA